MKEIKNTKNCKIGTLCERLAELDKQKKKIETEMKEIKAEITNRYRTENFDYAGNGFTVTKRQGKSTTWKTEELKVFLGNAYTDYQKTTDTTIIKVNNVVSK